MYAWICNTPSCLGYRDDTPSERDGKCFLCNRPQVRVHINATRFMLDRARKGD